MNIFQQELKMMRSSMLAWLGILCGLVFMYTALYPAFSNDVVAVQKILEKLPAAARAAIHLTSETFLTFLGFFAFTFINLTLAAGLYATHTGIGMLSREQRSKTTDFLLTKPRSRTNIFMQKFFAGLLALVTVWIVLTTVAYGLAKAFGAGEFSATRLVQLWLYCFGLFVSQILRRVKSTVSVTLAVTFGFFLINILAGLIKEGALRYLTPFGFFNYADIAAGKGFNLTVLMLVIASMAAMATAAYLMYRKRDIRAVA